MSAAVASAEPMVAEPELELAFPPRPEYVRMARHTVAALARIYDAPDQVVDDLKLAVSEACTNAVSVNAAADDEPVRVRAGVADGGFVVEVQDAGPGLDPSLLERDAELDSEEFTFERGLSLPLIRGLVEDLQIEVVEPRGSLIRMRLSFADADPIPE